jgi:hypothetical protein
MWGCFVGAPETAGAHGAQRDSRDAGAFRLFIRVHSHDSRASFRVTLRLTNLTPIPIFDILFDMQTNVSTLLREFPKIRRAALRGERVIIETREGNLVLTAEKPASGSILGSMRGRVAVTDDSLDEPTEMNWNPTL